MTELSLRVFRVAQIPLSDWWHYQNRRDGYWRLYRNDADGAWVESGGERVEIVANRWFLVPDLCLFDHGLDAPIPNHFYVTFDIPGVTGWALREAFGGPFLCAPTDELDPFVTTFDQNNNEDWAAHFGIHALVTGALSLALRQLPANRQSWNSSGDSALLPALEYIESHPQRAPTNEELAARCHLSKAHFIRRFRAATAHTPQFYLTRRRVALAAQKLAFSDDSIEHIADELGFSNRFYFSRVFAQHMGAAPAAYRQSATRYRAS